MLTAMKPVTDDAPITHALITHSNGDHTHGNQLLEASVRIIAAQGTAEELAHGMAPKISAMAPTAHLGPVDLANADFDRRVERVTVVGEVPEGPDGFRSVPLEGELFA